jgi:hypothetical protein
MRYPKKFSQLFLIIGFFFTACNSSPKYNETDLESESIETVFEVTLPSELESGSIIYLEILDEVTGISLNPQRYKMEPKDDFSLFVRVPFLEGSLVHYRYLMQSDINQIEHDPNGKQIYYRTYLADHPDKVQDRISNWVEQISSLPTGKISGFIYDNQTDLPIRGMNVSINGIRTVTLSNGYYEINRVPIGEYNIVAFHPDDLYEPFQQKAIIAENTITPASFGLSPANLVKITFNVEVPENTIKGAPLRLLGDTFSLGNVISENANIESIISTRAPLMEYLGDRKYSTTLELPSGADLRYKYSLGSGFINAERGSDGSLITHQLIIPKKDVVISNQIASWSSENDSPITFQISLPDSTPKEDVVSIQLNPFTWLQPIRMWKTEKNTWVYSLYGPFEYLDDSQFRFCRNDLCGIADDEKTPGKNGNGFLLNIENLQKPRTIKYELKDWMYLSNIEYQFNKTENKHEKPSYVKGIQLDNSNDPRWLPFYNSGFIDIAVNGANLIVFPVNRKIKPNQLPEITFSPDTNISYHDQDSLYTYAQRVGLNQALYPQITSEYPTMAAFWNSISPSYDWWLEWFSQYERFILDQAIYAEQSGIPVFIFGGKSILPALPSGSLPNGQFSNTPYDFPEKWDSLIVQLREKYSGQIIFAIPSEKMDNFNYEFLSNVDAFLVEIESILTLNTSPSINEINDSIKELFDTSIYRLVENYVKPVILAVNYASLDGSASNCNNLNMPCAEFLTFESSEIVHVDLAEQADIYRALMDAALERDWITGVISQGYFPAAILRDATSSIRGKPAMDVLSYYFNEVIK